MSLRFSRTKEKADTYKTVSVGFGSPCYALLFLRLWSKLGIRAALLVLQKFSVFKRSRHVLVHAALRNFELLSTIM